MKTINISGFDPSRVFFIGDLHHSHKNIIDFDKRDFSNLKEMGDYIEKTLSETLKPTDLLIDLGDLYLGSGITKLLNLLSCIPCPMYKIIGNHDKEKLFDKVKDKFIYYEDSFILETLNDKITVSHYPILDYPYMYNGGLEVFGHTHGHLDKFISSTPYLMVDLGFSSSFSKQAGTFIHSLDSVLSWFKRRTGGKEFKIWAQEMYHGKTSLWSE